MLAFSPTSLFSNTAHPLENTPCLDNTSRKCQVLRKQRSRAGGEVQTPLTDPSDSSFKRPGAPRKRGCGQKLPVALFLGRINGKERL
ncbi:hypothetical protein BaRGS_00038138 [Batillaria attramentaria]|uniref:Uncharacterized protein n=1 Tax=Batillaria attramentaria TaxID=370345 RepID=A0ABD0J847_9CAEN